MALLGPTVSNLKEISASTSTAAAMKSLLPSDLKKYVLASTSSLGGNSHALSHKPRAKGFYNNATRSSLKRLGSRPLLFDRDNFRGVSSAVKSRTDLAAQPGPVQDQVKRKRQRVKKRWKTGYKKKETISKELQTNVITSQKAVVSNCPTGKNTSTVVSNHLKEIARTSSYQTSRFTDTHLQAGASTYTCLSENSRPNLESIPSELGICISHDQNKLKFSQQIQAMFPKLNLPASASSIAKEETSAIPSIFECVCSQPSLIKTHLGPCKPQVSTHLENLVPVQLEVDIDTEPASPGSCTSRASYTSSSSSSCSKNFQVINLEENSVCSTRSQPNDELARVSNSVAGNCNRFLRQETAPEEAALADVTAEDSSSAAPSTCSPNPISQLPCRAQKRKRKWTKFLAKTKQLKLSPVNVTSVSSDGYEKVVERCTEPISVPHNESENVELLQMSELFQETSPGEICSHEPSYGSDPCIGCNASSGAVIPVSLPTQSSLSSSSSSYASASSSFHCSRKVPSSHSSSDSVSCPVRNLRSSVKAKEISLNSVISPTETTGNSSFRLHADSAVPADVNKSADSPNSEIVVKKIQSPSAYWDRRAVNTADDAAASFYSACGHMEEPEHAPSKHGPMTPETFDVLRRGCNSYLKKNVSFDSKLSRVRRKRVLRSDAASIDASAMTGEYVSCLSAGSFLDNVNFVTANSQINLSSSSCTYGTDSSGRNESGDKNLKESRKRRRRQRSPGSFSEAGTSGDRPKKKRNKSSLCKKSGASNGVPRHNVGNQELVDEASVKIAACVEKYSSMTPYVGSDLVPRENMAPHDNVDRDHNLLPLTQFNVFREESVYRNANEVPVSMKNFAPEGLSGLETADSNDEYDCYNLVEFAKCHKLLFSSSRFNISSGFNCSY
ncbi:uncharacterized protein LOC108669152 [Hyalella azteca]|uniref:Uncharacterized protein LOC108669152 n=1 Tax=Hyalella azteca TaxID=294128 RepID=A0A8B7NEA4_HYAAZ|nr:uncharacterized protein LOC108669152 [Hyalella azteca]XP_018011939.1 uncharacterized protein LOC108669152 [Hyalella azteca]XP_018011940.1 uncharacterized protein LOC108669152 [Hyalella azteca]